MRDLTAEEEFLVTLRTHPSAGHFRHTIEALEEMVEKQRKEKDHEEEEGSQ